MKPAKTWSVKGIDDMARNAAKRAAQEQGMTLGQWLNEMILKQAADAGAPAAGGGRRGKGGRGADDDISRKLDDLAEQLRALVRREQSTALAAMEAPRASDTSALAEVISRMEHNEAAVAETLEMMNARLDDLAARIGEAVQAREEGAQARDGEIEAALRNVVSHVEASETRTAETLENMNRRLEAVARQAAEAARLAAEGGREDHAAALRELEARLEQMNHRLEQMQAEADERTRAYVDTHMDRLVERVEAVHMASQTLPAKVENLVSEVAGAKLAEAEERINLMVGQLRGKLEEMAAGALDVERIGARVEEVGRKLEEVAERAASAQDLETMRAALEKLSSAMESKAERSEVQALEARMEERMEAFAARLRAEIEKGAPMPQFAALEGKVMELERKLAQAATAETSTEALRELESTVGGMEARIAQAERQLAQLPALEKAIATLSDRIEAGSGQVDDADLHALRAGLEAVRETAAASDAQMRETLSSVHETLFGIVNRIEALEKSTATPHAAGSEENTPTANEAAMAAAGLAGLAGAGAAPAREEEGAPEQAPQGAQAPAADAAPAQETPQTADLAAAAAMAAQRAEAAAEGAMPGAAEAPVNSGQGTTTDAPATALPEEDDADDFIAAARRAALAAAGEEEEKRASASLLARLRGRGTRSTEKKAADGNPGEKEGSGSGARIAAFIRPTRKTAEKAAKDPQAGAEKGRFSLSFLNRERKAEATAKTGDKGKAATKPAGKPADGEDQARKRRLMLMGVVLMAAVSAIIVKNRQAPAPVAQPAVLSAPEKTGAAAPAGEKAKPAPAQATPAKAAPAQKQGGGAEAGTAQQPQKQSHLAPEGAAMMPAAAQPAHADAITTASIGKVAETAGATAMAGPRAALRVDPRIGTPALRMAAEAGDARAQFIVASHYLQGRGVARDAAKAAQWYARAAAQGLAVAQYRLGTLYERGRGLPRSAALARHWYERAARAGNVKAMHNLAVILADNSHGKADYAGAARWFAQAAERALRDSQYNLAVLYQRGLGVEKDLAQAYKWYGLAARLGDADAAARQEALKPHLKPAQASRMDAEVAAWKPKKPLRSANFVVVDKPEWRRQKSQAAAAAPAAKATTASATGAHEQEAPARVLHGAERIRSIQKLLSRLGYDAGPADGKMGNRTANAIRLFQLQNGMPVNGQPTAQLLQRLQERTGARA